MNELINNTAEQGTWSVYLILCANGALYCGISNDVDKRWKAHCAGKGAKYTRMHKPVLLKEIYTDLSASAARKLEYQTKQLSKLEKQGLWDGCDGGKDVLHDGRVWTCNHHEYGFNTNESMRVAKTRGMYA
jgi:putative endonuclease